MPELPEVETVKRDLAKALIGQTIGGITVYDDRVIKDLSSPTFIQNLKGKTFLQIDRRSKAIIFQFEEGDYLVSQLKMTGFFLYKSKPIYREDLRDCKVAFSLSSGAYLYYLDQRTFGWLIYTNNLKTISYLNTAGPEPLDNDFKVSYLEEGLRRKTAPIKNILLDQHFIAGIGNIYASEILFAARIHPETPGQKLSRNDLKRLKTKTQSILSEAIELRGTSMRNYRDSKGEKGQFINRLKVYNRAGNKCTRCKASLERIVQAGRSTFFCPECQQ